MTFATFMVMKEDHVPVDVLVPYPGTGSESHRTLDLFHISPLLEVHGLEYVT